MTDPVNWPEFKRLLEHQRQLLALAYDSNVRAEHEMEMAKKAARELEELVKEKSPVQ